MTRRGRLRGSTARTFLAEARHRANLKVETDALATRLLFDGKRCDRRCLPPERRSTGSRWRRAR